MNSLSLVISLAVLVLLQPCTSTSTVDPLLASLRRWVTPRLAAPSTNKSSDTSPTNAAPFSLEGNYTSDESTESIQKTPDSSNIKLPTKRERFRFGGKESIAANNVPVIVVKSKNETTEDLNQTGTVREELITKANRTADQVPLSYNETQNLGPAANATSTAPSFIVVQRSPLVATKPIPQSYYKSGLVIPSSQTNPLPLHSPQNAESGLVVIISALLPVLSKLFLLMMLSGSSLFFGPSDVHPIYSPNPTQHFILERVNDRYSRDDLAFQRAVRFPPANKGKRVWNILLGQRRRILKRSMDSAQRSETPPIQKTTRNDPLYARTVLIVDVHTEDIQKTVEYLRDAISFILHQYHSMDTRLDFGTDLEVVFNVESPGGIVQDYGLAADQIARLRNSGKERGDLTVTVCVDKIAASGGYMIACQASPGQLLAAPLAIVGSIGVLRETLNIHDILTKYGIQPLLIKAGKAKVPLTSTNEVTKEGLAFVQKNVDTTHEVFKKIVLAQRGHVINAKHFDEVTSGDTFLATNALALGLVDRLITSDEYIADKVRQGNRVLRLQKYDKSRAWMRFSPLDLLFPHKDGFIQGKLQWVQRLSPMILPFLKLGLSAGLMKAFDFV